MLAVTSDVTVQEQEPCSQSASPKSIEDRLAKLTGRSKSYWVRQALQAHSEEIEDPYTAWYRLEHPAQRWTLEELEQGRDLER